MQANGPQGSAAIQVHIVALPLTAWGLVRLLQDEAHAMQVASQSSTVAECLAALQPGSTQVVLVDLDGPTIMEDLSALSSKSNTKILVLTGWLQADLLDRAILAGARGVVSKREQPATLLKAIQCLHRGEIWMDRDATGRIFMQLVKRQGQPDEKEDEAVQIKIASLTRRERQTVAALASNANAPGKVIANQLHISEHTLRNHLTAIYDKLQVSNRLALYAFAHRHGLAATSGAPGAIGSAA